MTLCDAYREALLTADLETLQGRGEAPLARHLAACSGCREAARVILSETERLDGLLAAGLDPLDPSELVRRARTEAHPAPTPSPWRRRRGWWLATGGLLAAAVAGVLVLPSRPTPSPGPPRPALPPDPPPLMEAAPGHDVATGLAFPRMVGFDGAPDLDTRTFALDALPPHAAEALVAPYVYMDREESPGTMTATEGTLTVRETPDNLDKIARVLQEYDHRAADIRLHFQLVEAGDVPGDAGPVEAVEEQLRRLFDFDGYRLAGEAFVTVSERGEFAQTLAGTDELYEIQAQVFRAGDAALRLHEARLHGPRGLALMTTVNIRAGQTLVLGSSNTGTDGTTLFLTVRAETEGG